MLHPTPSFSVIKVGGGLSRVPGALDRVAADLSRLSRRHSLLIVPGGGPFADAVRRFADRVAVSADALHWMAILAMDQCAWVLAERIPGAALIEEPAELPDVFSRGKIAVLAPSRWMRSADVFPHSWDVTSDSIAAFVAGALGAERLALLKPDGHHLGVDGHFLTALPDGLPYLILSWDRLDELPVWLSGRTAVDARPE